MAGWIFPAPVEINKSAPGDGASQVCSSRLTRYDNLHFSTPRIREESFNAPRNSCGIVAVEYQVIWDRCDIIHHLQKNIMGCVINHRHQKNIMGCDINYQHENIVLLRLGLPYRRNFTDFYIIFGNLMEPSSHKFLVGAVYRIHSMSYEIKFHKLGINYKDRKINTLNLGISKMSGNIFIKCE